MALHTQRIGLLLLLLSVSACANVDGLLDGLLYKALVDGQLIFTEGDLTVSTEGFVFVFLNYRGLLILSLVGRKSLSSQ